MIGTTPSESSEFKTALIFCTCADFVMSSKVIKTWEVVSANRWKDWVYFAINKPCPTEAAACCRVNSAGLAVNLRGAKPAAIAPEETNITSAPSTFNLAKLFTKASTAAGSRFSPAWPVKVEEPTFTTTRL